MRCCKTDSVSTDQ